MLRGVIALTLLAATTRAAAAQTPDLHLVRYRASPWVAASVAAGGVLALIPDAAGRGRILRARLARRRDGCSGARSRGRVRELAHLDVGDDRVAQGVGAPQSPSAVRRARPGRGGRPR